MDQILYEHLPTFGKIASHRFPRTQGIEVSRDARDFLSNPLPLHRTVTATIVPGAPIEYWSYEVPLNRRALIQLANASLLRIFAAPAAALTQAWIALQRFQSSNLEIVLIAFAQFQDLAVGVKDQSQLQSQIELFAGDRLGGQAIDLSAGGSVLTHIQLRVLEYDAVRR